MQVLNKSLYNIRQEHLVLLNEVDINEGELTPEVEEALSITKEEFANKAVSYGYVLKSFDDSVEMVDKEIKRLQDLKKKAIRRQELIKERLSEAMQEFGIEKLNTPTLSLSFRKSESVEIEDASKVPFAYVTEEIIKSISKMKIKNDLKAGVEVPGAKLITNQNLQIK